MPERPLISILTPTRNRRADFLPLAIASVRALRLDCAWEHVVVDDGSDDDTAGYLADEAATDPGLRVVCHDRPRGVAAARNSGARAARGDFLVDLDDDDLLLADGVARRYRYLRAHPEFWAVHANALKINEAGHYLIGQDVRNFLCTEPKRCARHFYDSTMIPNASTAMYRRSALLALGGWDEALRCCEDYDLWLRSLERYGPPGFLDEPVALYRSKEQGLGIDSIRNGVHARNQRLLKARWAHLVATPARDTDSAK
jgi:glycosyltransferase involved in cell wall biosynthesis